MAVVQVSAKVDGKIRDKAEKVFGRYGLDVSTVIRSMLTLTVENNRLPFVIGGVSLNDGFGSYVCEDGYLHDYGKLNPKLDAAVKETVGPFDSVDDLMKSLDDE